MRSYLYDNLPDLQRLIRIPSVYDESTSAPGCPCGRAVADALSFMGQIAIEDGFEVKEYDGNAIAICLKPLENDHDGECGRIDVVSHLDVVEPGDGWNMDPFSGEIIGGRLYGRGTQDMKASAYLTYLALKRIRDEGAAIKREIRIVYGTDEERTMNDIIYYVDKEGLPDFAFTPDGSFPMAIGEKGALMWRLCGSYPESSAGGDWENATESGTGNGTAYGRENATVHHYIRSLDCGVQCNVVSPIAKAVLLPGLDEAVLIDKIRELGIDAKVQHDAGGINVTVYGKAAHASRPWDGHSATVDMLHLLGTCGDDVMQNLYECFRDPYGDALGIKSVGERDVTINLGIFRIEDGICYGEVDARYPYGITAEYCTGKLSEHCALDVSLDYDSPPILNDINDPYVQVLLSAYRSKTGDDMEPYVSGGVSYSKIFGHCVAFGPMLPDEESLAHQANESIALSDLVTALDIYYKAIKELVCRNEE